MACDNRPLIRDVPDGSAIVSFLHIGPKATTARRLQVTVTTFDDTNAAVAVPSFAASREHEYINCTSRTMFHAGGPVTHGTS